MAVKDFFLKKNLQCSGIHQYDGRCLGGQISYFISPYEADPEVIHLAAHVESPLLSSYVNSMLFLTCNYPKTMLQRILKIDWQSMTGRITTEERVMRALNLIKEDQGLAAVSMIYLQFIERNEARTHCYIGG